MNENDIVTRLRENADLDAAEHCNHEVVALELEAADEIVTLREKLNGTHADLMRAKVAACSSYGYLWRSKADCDHMRDARISLGCYLTKAEKDYAISITRQQIEDRAAMLFAMLRKKP